jgi:hypothetical protein
MLQEQHAMKAVISDEAEAIAATYIAELEGMQAELRMHSRLAELLRGGTVPQARLALESNIAGFAANMMDMGELIMSQQLLLEQELELEENYIHILHTLADLHILTLGVLDPMPHYTPTQRPVIAETNPVAIELRTFTAADAGASIARAAERLQPGKHVPPITTSGTVESFVDALGLPGKEAR